MDAEEILNLVKILLIIFYSITLLFSIVISIGCFGLYQKAGKKESNAFIPIINLFSILEIAELKTILGILFFIPVLNLIIMYMVGSNLAKIFNAKGSFKLGLQLLPIVFLPMLSFNDMKYKISDEEYMRMRDNAKDETVNLLKQSEFEKLNEQENNDTPNVDSIFKSEWETKEAPPAYKAQRAEAPHKEESFEMYELEPEIEKQVPKPIEEIKPEEVRTEEPKESKSGKFVVNPDELEDSLEVIDL